MKKMSIELHPRVTYDPDAKEYVTDIYLDGAHNGQVRFKESGYYGTALAVQDNPNMSRAIQSRAKKLRRDIKMLNLDIFLDDIREWNAVDI